MRLVDLLLTSRPGGPLSCESLTQSETLIEHSRTPLQSSPQSTNSCNNAYTSNTLSRLLMNDKVSGNQKTAGIDSQSTSGGSCLRKAVSHNASSGFNSSSSVAGSSNRSSRSSNGIGSCDILHSNSAQLFSSNTSGCRLLQALSETAAAAAAAAKRTVLVDRQMSEQDEACRSDVTIEQHNSFPFSGTNFVNYEKSVALETVLSPFEGTSESSVETVSMHEDADDDVFTTRTSSSLTAAIPIVDQMLNWHPPADDDLPIPTKRDGGLSFLSSSAVNYDEDGSTVSNPDEIKLEFGETKNMTIGDPDSDCSYESTISASTSSDDWMTGSYQQTCERVTSCDVTSLPDGNALCTTLQLDENGQFGIENLPLFNFNDVGAQFEIECLASEQSLQKISSNSCNHDQSAQESLNVNISNTSNQMQSSTRSIDNNSELEQRIACTDNGPLNTDRPHEVRHHPTHSSAIYSSSEVLKLLLANRPSQSAQLRSLAIKAGNNSSSFNGGSSIDQRRLSSQSPDSAYSNGTNRSPSSARRSTRSQSTTSSTDRLNIRKRPASRMAAVSIQEQQQLNSVETKIYTNDSDDANIDGKLNGCRTNLRQETITQGHKQRVVLDGSRSFTDAIYQYPYDDNARGCASQIINDEWSLLMTHFCNKNLGSGYTASQHNIDGSLGPEILQSALINRLEEERNIRGKLEQIREQHAIYQRSSTVPYAVTSPQMMEKNLTNSERFNNDVLLQNLFPLSASAYGYVPPKRAKVENIKTEMNDVFVDTMPMPLDHDYCQNVDDDLLDCMPEKYGSKKGDNSALKNLLLDKNLREEVRMQAEKDREQSRQRMMKKIDKMSCLDTVNKCDDYDIRLDSVETVELSNDNIDCYGVDAMVDELDEDGCLLTSADAVWNGILDFQQVCDAINNDTNDRQADSSITSQEEVPHIIQPILDSCQLETEQQFLICDEYNASQSSYIRKQMDCVSFENNRRAGESVERSPPNPLDLLAALEEAISSTSKRQFQEVLRMSKHVEINANAGH